MGEVSTTFTSDDKQVSAAYDKLYRENVKLREEMGKTSDASKVAAKEAAKAAQEQERLGREGKRTFEATRTPLEAYNLRLAELRKQLQGGVIDQQTFGRAAEQAKQQLAGGGSLLQNSLATIGKMTAGYLSAKAAIGLINTELERKAALEAKSLDAQVSLSDAQAGAIRNLGAVSQGDRDQFVAGVHKISQDTGIPLAQAFQTASQAVGSTSSIADALAVARTAAEAIPESTGLGERQTLASSLGSIGKISGDKDPRNALGFILGLQKSSQVKSSKQVADNLVPALVGIAARGDSLQDAGALLASLTKTFSDTEGAVTGTAGLQLAGQLADFLPQEDRFEFKKGKRSLAAKGTGLKSTRERIEFLQQNAAERERFLAGASFEVKAEGGLAQLLSGPDTAAAQGFRQSLRDLPTVAASGANAANVIAALRSTDAGKAAGFERQQEELRARSDVVDPEEAFAASVRKDLDTVLARSGGSVLNPIARKTFEAATAVGVDPAEAFKFVTDGIRKELEGNFGGLNVLPVSDKDRELLELYRKMIANQEQQLAELKAQRAEARNARPGSAKVESSTER